MSLLFSVSSIAGTGLVIKAEGTENFTFERRLPLTMVALCNRADHYILPCDIYLLLVLNLYILNAVRCPYVRTSVTVGVASSVANDVITRMTS